MKIKLGYLLLAITVLFAVVFYFSRQKKMTVDSYAVVDRLPEIYPDYNGVTLPPNIAPLNFTVKEKGTYYYVKISSANGDAIDIFCKNEKITIPPNRWRELLAVNKGNDLKFDVFVRDNNGKWNLFTAITNKIAVEPVDDYLVYRRMHPTHHFVSGKIAIYQRNLNNFQETVVLDGSSYGQGCVNCHTFVGNSPEKVLMGVRSPRYGSKTLLIEGDTAKKIGTKFTYTTWHPSGKMAVYTISNVCQFFHSAREEIRQAIDTDSTLVYYLAGDKKIRTSDDISKKNELETYPTFSPDGKYLYFCRTEILWTKKDKLPPAQYKDIKYSLVRAPYDVNTNKWGQVETVLSSKDTNLSILLPRFSPDGCWLVFCMADYGCFPAFQTTSDLYIMDMKKFNETGETDYRNLGINSEKSESWHSWSSNNRWLVFSSKRDNGVFTRLYLSYIDENGNASKPTVLPQKDPEFYNSCLTAFNTPELITGTFRITGEKLSKIVRGSDEVSVDVPITMASPGTTEDNYYKNVRE